MNNILGTNSALVLNLSEIKVLASSGYKNQHSYFHRCVDLPRIFRRLLL